MTRFRLRSKKTLNERRKNKAAYGQSLVLFQAEISDALVGACVSAALHTSKTSQVESSLKESTDVGFSQLITGELCQGSSELSQGTIGELSQGIIGELSVKIGSDRYPERIPELILTGP